MSKEIKLPPPRVLIYSSPAFGQQQMPYYNDRDLIAAILADRKQAQARIAELEAALLALRKPSRLNTHQIELIDAALEGKS